MNKRVAAFIISIIILLSNVAPVWADVQDYREIEFKDSADRDVFKPTAQFSVTHNGTTYESPEGTDINSNALIISTIVGDTVTVEDLSRSNRGKTLKVWDFQYTRPDGKNEFFTTRAFEKSYTLDKPGTYTFSLCVRDNIENEAWTNYWGNWSDNGNHRVIGNNPGQDAGDPSDDFDGYWYFTRIVIIAEKNPPTADFKIYYKGKDVTDNKTSPAIIDPEDMRLVLEDCSTPFSAAEPITSRKWSYWDVNSGWKEIPGSTNKTAVNISNMDSSLPGSGTNKAFKLDVTSSSGGIDDESHTAYFKKVLTSGYIVYYRDQDTGRDIYPAKVMEGLGFGTYTETARTAPENGELVTPSPTTIVLDAAHPFVEFVFYYKFTTPPPEPSTDPPTAILKLPKEVMAGAPVKADGSDSWSNNPGGYIADWDFEYEGANLIKDNGSDVRIWYPATGTYEVYLEVEDENGDTDWDEQEIEVKLPIPTAVITVTGILKENRKVTISSINSTSPQYYPIDVAKIVWTITPASGGTEADIKYTGTLSGNVSKDLLFKKAGTYRIRLTVYNTYGRSASAEQTITIAPDMPPVAKITLPTPAGVPYKTYRDPGNSNYATAQIFNESYSPDGDTINKAVVLYCYDSDNDGDYKDEQWYYSKDGDTWTSTGMTYANTVSFFNIYNIATSNVSQFTLKSKEVGRYHFAIRVMETILASETIPEFITESDYKRNDDF
jgi:hypothetical protein